MKAEHGLTGNAAALAALGFSMFLLAAPSPARAEATADPGNADLGDLNLEELLRLKVVTATGGVAEESDLAPANVFTVLASEIANHGWRSLADILANVPGMYVVNDYVTHNVSVRGASGGLRAGSRIIKVMINGTDVSFRPDLNALIGPAFIPVDMIERVEIARGPLSALYGANAFLATVNVITVDPQRLAAQLGVNGVLRPVAGGQTRLGYGGSGMISHRLGDRLRLLLGASYESLDRGGLVVEQTFPGQTSLNAPLGQATGRDLRLPLSVFGRMTSTSKRFGETSWQGGIQQLDSGGQFQLNSVLSGSRYALRNVWTSAQNHANWTDMVSTQVAIGLAQGGPTANERLYLTPSPVSLDPATGQQISYYSRNFDYKSGDAKAAVTVQPRPNLRFSGGVDGTWEKHGTLYYSQHFLIADAFHNVGDVVINNNDPVPVPEVTVKKVAPNLHAMYSPIPNVRLYADGRLDYSNLFPSQFSWRASAGWRILPNLVVKAIGGKAFQTPSTVFLYAYQGFGASNDIQGSKNVPAAGNLVPQVVQSGELVLNYIHGDRFSMNLAGYLQSVEKQIVFIRNLAGTFYAQNEGTATSYGAEVNLTVRVWKLEPYVRLSKQWFKDGGVQLGTGPEVPPALIPAYWALAGLRLSLPNPRLTVDATWKAVGERGASQSNIAVNGGNSYSLAAYNQFDLAATATFSPLGKNRDTRLILSGRNVLNQKFFEPGFGGIDVPGMGRVLMLNVLQTF